MKGLIIVALLASGFVMAEGGKVGHPTLLPIETGEGCVFAVPAGIDLDNCEILFQDNQSGVTNWVCADQTYIVTCPPGDDSPGNSGKDK